MRKLLICAGLLLALGTAAADRIAVAEPVVRGGMDAAEVEALWAMLESSVGDEYEVISRTAFKAMLTEIELTENSGLVDLNSTQKAALGRVSGVKYILTSNVGVFGRRLNVSLALINASTGEMVPGKRCSEMVGSLDELADKLPDMLNTIGLGAAVKKSGRWALLAPVIRVAGAPGYLAEDFNVRLEEELINRGFRLQNLKSVAKILQDNNIGDLESAEPAIYARVGALLRVDYLIQPSINRFSCTVSRKFIQVTRREAVRCIGDVDGSIRIIDAATGELVKSISCKSKIDYDDIEDTEDWSAEDFDKYLIENFVAEIVKKTAPAVKK